MTAKASSRHFQNEEEMEEGSGNLSRERGISSTDSALMGPLARVKYSSKIQNDFKIGKSEDQFL
jgi:hypothetical protein